MTPKEKAIYEVLSKEQLCGKHNILISHIERSLDIALQEQAKEISEDIINYIKQKYLHNPVKKHKK